MSQYPHSLNLGKYKTEYSICIIHRGHVHARDKDIVVKFKGRVIDRVGYSRPHSGKYLFIMNELKFTA